MALIVIYGTPLDYTNKSLDSEDVIWVQVAGEPVTRILKLRLMKNDKTNLVATFARPRGTAASSVQFTLLSDFS